MEEPEIVPLWEEVRRHYEGPQGSSYETAPVSARSPRRWGSHKDTMGHAVGFPNLLSMILRARAPEDGKLWERQTAAYSLGSNPHPAMRMAIQESDEVYMSVYTFDDLEMAIRWLLSQVKG